MRSAKLHSEADLLLLGYTDIRVHKWMDAATKIMGPSHRMIGHNFKIVQAMGLIFGKAGRRCALLHLLLDLDIIDSEYIENQLKIKKEAKKCKA